MTAVAKVRVELDSNGIGKLLKEPGVKRDMKRRAEAIARAAGPGHEVETDDSGDRSRATVVTRSAEAKRREYRNRTLSRAVRSGGGR